MRTGDTIEIPGDYQHRALHDGFIVQRFWHSNKLEVVKRFGLPSASEAVLDLGCGSGVVADFLAQFAGRAVGIDGNVRAIEFARSAYSRPNLTFELGLLHEINLPEHSFDTVYSFEVIEHLPRVQVLKLLADVRRILRPGGRVIVTTPNYRSLWPAIEWLMDALKLAPQMSEHQHVYKLYPSELRALAQDAGFVVTRLFRDFGVAPFASVLGWKFAELIRRGERSLGTPLGNIVCAELRPK